jgi:hypothetical protein
MTSQVFTRLDWAICQGCIALRKNRTGSLDERQCLRHIPAMLQCSKNLINLQGWDNGDG